MRALSIRQPWASLIIDGHKDVENRSWAVGYRGRIVIHAGLAPAPPDQLAHVDTLVKLGYAPHHDLADLPRGVILGTVDLVDIVQNYDSAWTMDTTFQWVFANPMALVNPVPYKGAQGLWAVPDDVGPFR